MATVQMTGLSIDQVKRVLTENGMVESISTSGSVHTFTNIFGDNETETFYTTQASGSKFALTYDLDDEWFVIVNYTYGNFISEGFAIVDNKSTLSKKCFGANSTNQPFSYFFLMGINTNYNTNTSIYPGATTTFYLLPLLCSPNSITYKLAFNGSLYYDISTRVNYRAETPGRIITDGTNKYIHCGYGVYGKYNE